MGDSASVTGRGELSYMAGVQRGRPALIRTEVWTGLATFPREVAVRMVTDYLKDLENQSTAVVPEHSLEVRKEDYRAALKDLQTSLEHEPDTPLTMQEREILTRMLDDYMHVTKKSLGVDLDIETPRGSQSTIPDNGEEEEKFIVELRPPTWGELNDPRRVCDESREVTELEASYPILLEVLTAALQACVDKIQDMIRVKSQVKVFGFQCAHVVDTLSARADEKFLGFRHTLALVENFRVHNLTVEERRAWFKCVTFCIRSLVSLTRTFQTVVGLFSACGVEEWWRTALKFTQVPPESPQVPRWTVFGLALRQCQWNMDIATLAFFAMEKRYNLGAVLDSNDFVFVWSDKRRRLVLQLQGDCSEKSLNNTEDLTGSMDIGMELEAKDIADLILNLEDLKEKSIKKWKPFHLDAELIADFLITKLRGPPPRPSYLPWTFQVDHANLKYKDYVDAGSYGMVAKYKWYREKVAVKSIRAPGLIRKKFEEEAAILGTVQHPNVVQLLGCGFKKKIETGMLVMELMEHDLRTVIEKRCPEPGPESGPPFPLFVALDIMLQIAEAMQYLREHKVLHRDLKAKNILINRCNVPDYKTLSRNVDITRFPYLAALIVPEECHVAKLADFGLAKVRPFTSRVLVTHMAGTTAWRAPEVFHILDAEVASEYKWPADVYSYAMTCYEILTGRIPFQDITPISSLHSRILAGERPDLGLGNALPSLTELIERCWDTIPEKRPQFPEICKKLWQCKVEAILSVFRLS